MANTFFIADPHWSHKNIIRLCNRPFSTVEQMDRAMIDNWNKVVSDDDRVFVVGDFALCGKEKLIEIGNSLKGRKTLILGNHDERSMDVYLEAGFKYVIPHTIILDEFFVISHAPPTFMSEEMPWFYIYGHVHNSEMYQTITARSACVSVERWDYTPVSLDTLKEKAIAYAKTKM